MYIILQYMLTYTCLFCSTDKIVRLTVSKLTNVLFWCC